MIIWIFDLHTVTLGIWVFFHIYMSPTSCHPNSWAQICSLVHPIQTRYPGLWNSVGLIHATANASNWLQTNFKLVGGFMSNIWPQPTEARTHRLKKQSSWMSSWWLNQPIQNILHSPSLTWNLKMMLSNRNLLFQGLIFRFHVKLQECSQNENLPQI